MKTKAIIFTCNKHIEAAKIAAEAASKYFDVILAMDGNEQVGELGQNCIKTNFARNGNLNGMSASLGVAQTLLAHCDSGYVVKLDSDMVIKDDSQLVGNDIAGFPQPRNPPTLLGCCYHISRRALEHAIACLSKAEALGVQVFPEDTIITGYAQTLHVSDFKQNIMPLNTLGVWHPVRAPVMRGKIANFGINRIAGNWCHEQSLAAMRQYANS